MSLDFPGKEKLIGLIDEAVHGDCPTTITTCLQDVLCQCIGDDEIRLPAVLFESVDEHYARREIHQDPQQGYSVIAMTWGPGQGTPIHDHAGMWCVEGVWAGCVKVDQYQLLDRQEDQYRFERVGSIRAGCGSAGSLIPPHEYHTISNPDREQTAVSIHIYSGEMTCCNVFQQGAEGWFMREQRNLGLD